MRTNGVTLSNKEYKKLHELYTGFSKNNTSTFGSAANLQKTSKLPLSKVLHYLHSNSTYTKFKTPIRKFKRLIAISPAIDEIWSMDLAFVDKLARHNNNVNYLLVSVDVLSRVLRVEPLVNKEATTTKEGLLQMVEKNRGRFPRKIWVDQGTEFRGSFAVLCKEKSIVIYSTHSETKSALAERYIRTLKNVLYKYLEHKHAMQDTTTTTTTVTNTNVSTRKLRSNKSASSAKPRNERLRYIDKLQDIVKLVNGRVNRTIKMAPGKVKPLHTDYLLKLQNERDQKQQQNPSSNPTQASRGKRKKNLLKVNDIVRVVEENRQFKKGYKPQFTEKLYVIKRVVPGNPTTYELKTYDTQPEQTVLGKFYQPELVKYVPKPVH